MPATITIQQNHNEDAIRATLTLKIEVQLSGLEEIQSLMSREQMLTEKIIKEVADAVQPGWLEDQEPDKVTDGGVHPQEECRHQALLQSPPPAVRGI